MPKIRYIKDKNGDIVLPVTHERGVIDSNGVNLETKLDGKQPLINNVSVDVDNQSGTPSGSASLDDGTLTIHLSNIKGEKGETGPVGPQGQKGPQGNTGSSVDYPYELVNNLTTDDATKGLTAAQGKVLGDKVSDKNYIDGYRTTASGITADSDYIVTERIPGSAGDKVNIHNTGATSRYTLAYDASGNVLGYRSQSYEYYNLPEDTASFVVCFAKTASNPSVYKNNVLVWQKTDAPGTFVGTEIEINDVNNKVEELSDVPSELFNEERVPFLGQLNYNIETTGKFGTNTTYKHSRMRVMPGDIIHFSNTDMNRDLNVAFLSTYEYTPTSGGDIPLFNSIKPFPHCMKGSNGGQIMSEKTIVIPEGCYAIAFGVYSTLSPKLTIRRQKNNPVVHHYRQYISDKAFALMKKDIDLGQSADSFIFFTDYHIPSTITNTCTNFQHSWALIDYLREKTNTRRVFFGGDIFTSPDNDNERYSLMYSFLGKFAFVQDMYSAVGNHEWRQSNNNDGRIRDFGSLAKKLEGIVTFGRDTNGVITQPYYYFDNPALKIRYFVLYTPGTNESSTYAIFNYTEQINFLYDKIRELDDTWKSVVVQHIVYENGSSGSSVYDDEGFPTKVYVTSVGIQIKDAIKSINSGNGAKIVCLLSGHLHNEFCEFVDSYCVSICQNCDATYTYEDGDYKVFPNNHVRDWGSINEQSFDVYHIDINNNIVFGTKIGYGADKIINITEQSVQVGSTLTLTSSFSSVDVWQSQNDAVATVDDGVVTAISAGRVTIRAKMFDTPNSGWEYFNIIVV